MLTLPLLWFGPTPWYVLTRRSVHASGTGDAMAIERYFLSTLTIVVLAIWIGLVGAERDGRIILYRLKTSVLDDALLGFADALGMGTTSKADARSKRKRPTLRSGEA